MTDVPPIFDHAAAFDPSADLDTLLTLVPARWAVYLMADSADEPIQLLCVKNLRASLKRRLAGGELVGPSRKVDYREIVRRIHWRRVDSTFEADLAYLEAASTIFPQSYRGMMGLRPAWFVHVNPAAKFPRYTKTSQPGAQPGRCFGPIEDKHVAQKLVHLIENTFDLCRDYSILTQSPNAGPCSWRQMGKCVGPCDGSISLDGYRDLIAHTADALANPQRFIDQHTERMKAAAAELRFETAAKIKSWIEAFAQATKGPLRHLRPLERLRFLSMQRGPWAKTAELFLVTPGEVTPVASLVSEPARPSDLVRHILSLGDRALSPLNEPAVERLGLVSHHLFLPRQKQGIFIPLDELDDRALLRAYREIVARVPAETTDEGGEGVTHELHAI